MTPLTQTHCILSFVTFQTPLHDATYEGHAEAAKILVEHGAAVNIKEKVKFSTNG